MRDITIIKYLLEAVDNNYIEKFVVKQFNNYEICIVINVLDSDNVATVYNMIEANIYTRKDLLGKAIYYSVDGYMIITTINEITYKIRVKSKRSSKENRNKRRKHMR